MADEMDFSPDLMTLVDEDGKEHMFEVLDAIETDDGRYLAMVLHYDEVEELLESDAELVIMKVLCDDEGEYLEAIDNEKEFSSISAIFTERLEDEFDIEAIEDIENDHKEDPCVVRQISNYLIQHFLNWESGRGRRIADLPALGPDEGSAKPTGGYPPVFVRVSLRLITGKAGIFFAKFQ